MAKASTAKRNREIYARYKAGECREALAKRYLITPNTIEHIIYSEQHKIAVSAEGYYREIRVTALLG